MDREIEKLKKRILALSAVVENSVEQAVLSVTERNESLAARVIDLDNEIDQMEVDVEEECLKILALHQPVANDLRFVIAVLKINNDLERIGDEAVNIAERAFFLSRHTPIKIPFDFTMMSDKTQAMLRLSLDALVTLNTDLAREVGARDDEVDDLNRQMYLHIQNEMRRQQNDVECLVHVLSISRHLERIADYATNIAEDVIYLIEGEIVRHKAETFH